MVFQGIKQTGNTIKANNISVIELLGETTLRVIEAVENKISSQQRQILDDFIGIVVVSSKTNPNS